MNRQLEDEVRAALRRDERIVNPADVAVLDEGGVVTLRGTVNSPKQRHAAVEDAQSVSGVYDVVDELRVHLLNDDRADDELRGRALQALHWDPRVPDDRVDARVASLWITLTGEVRHQSQSDAAFEDVCGLPGVGGVTNKIVVVTA